MLIIKVGGGREINIDGIARDLPELHEKSIIVHGANAIRDQLAIDLGRPKKVITSVSGYSSVFSDDSAIDLIMMGYSGVKNKRLVEACQQNGINAVGLSGIDGGLIQGARNKGIRVKEGEKVLIVRDCSGKPKRVNKELLDLLLDHGYLPVICIPIADENKFAINSENDDIVNVLQQTFRAESVIHLIEAPGYLADKEDEGSLIGMIPKEDLPARESQVEGRMKRKMLALRNLLENGASKVIIADGRVEHPIRDALQGKGPIIQ
jgi:acetylglutamate/LysW-gamma-L-alpha-aminoadipate kinase